MCQVYAFGSSTPRELAHLSKLAPEWRVYDVRLVPINGDKRSKTTGTFHVASRIASLLMTPDDCTSACRVGNDAATALFRPATTLCLVWPREDNALSNSQSSEAATGYV